jgi:hypothetical protein
VGRKDQPQAKVFDVALAHFAGKNRRENRKPARKF